MRDIKNLGFKHIHLDECHSTQQILKNQLSTHQFSHPILVSTQHQTQGVGRRGNAWHIFKDSLAFSFSWPLRDNLTLSPLQIGVLLKKFFFSSFQKKISLKWPNDLLDIHGKKVGGILIHHFGECLIVGVGINLNPDTENKKFDYPHSFLLDTKMAVTQSLYEEIYSYLLHHQNINDEEIKREWNQACFHLNKKVLIIDEEQKIEGTFIGIGALGEALLENQQGIQKVYAGSLRF